MNILILGQEILAIDVTEETDRVIASSAVYPKSTITGWQIVNATLPAGYVQGHYIYSGGQVIPCPVQSAATCTATCAARCLEVDALWSAKLWTNHTATFPVGERIIQFRNSGDQAAIESVYGDALGKVASGAPTAVVKFYTEDNAWQYPTAEEMRIICKGLFDSKQILKVKATEHKAALRALRDVGDTAGILAYNIQTGW